MEVFEAFGSCPRCGNGVDFRDNVAVCSKCGWMPEPKNENAKSYKKHILALCVISFIAFVQVINWGSYSVEIIPLKTKSLFGLASLEDYNRLAKICEEQLKYGCAADALSDKATETENAEDFKLLGDLYRRMSQWDDAILAYENALAKMEKDKGDAYYGLAKSLHESGKIDMAEDYYKKAIDAKPGVLQITVTLDYAKMLNDAGRSSEAKNVIASAEKKSGIKGRFDGLVDL